MGVARSNVLLTIMRPMMRLSVDSWEGGWMGGKGKTGRLGVWWGMLLTEFLLQEPKYLVSVPQGHRNTVLFKVDDRGWLGSFLEKRLIQTLLQPPHLVHPSLKGCPSHMAHASPTQEPPHSLSNPHPVDALRSLLCLFAQGSRYDPRRSI